MHSNGLSWKIEITKNITKTQLKFHLAKGLATMKIRLYMERPWCLVFKKKITLMTIKIILPFINIFKKNKKSEI